MTIGELLKYLYPERPLKDAITWPPDTFALCAALLQKSGGYTVAVMRWPPEQDHFPSGAEWVIHIRKIATEWRNGVAEKKIPQVIKKWWKTILEARRTPIDDLCSKERTICETIIQLAAAADEACEGIGLSNAPEDSFDELVHRVLTDQMRTNGRITTLSNGIDAKKLCILPKLHTPRTGITIRSMSHHLALCHVGEVSPELVIPPHTIVIDNRLNLLLLPWSKTVSPADFSPAQKTPEPLFNMSKEFGLFDYKIRGGRKWPRSLFQKILNTARGTVGEIHGIVLPELALTEKEEDSAWQQLRVVFPNAFMITGIGRASRAGKLGLNRARCRLPITKERDTAVQQDKHHRWLLDPSQIQQYGLSAQLERTKSWWENTTISNRSLKFIRMNPWLLMSFLICEDLARQDPIADLLRAVGSNLVLCLLMDGPQLASRWPSRYATVLADDPGSSVLTLTSIGMARLSCCLGKPESRVVALWKDASSGPFELELPFDAEALVLSLELECKTEWTADGRSCENSAGHWRLRTVQPLRLST